MCGEINITNCIRVITQYCALFVLQEYGLIVESSEKGTSEVRKEIFNWTTQIDCFNFSSKRATEIY